MQGGKPILCIEHIGSRTAASAPKPSLALLLDCPGSGNILLLDQGDSNLAAYVAFLDTGDLFELQLTPIAHSAWFSVKHQW